MTIKTKLDVFFFFFAVKTQRNRAGCFATVYEGDWDPSIFFLVVVFSERGYGWELLHMEDDSTFFCCH